MFVFTIGANLRLLSSHPLRPAVLQWRDVPQSEFGTVAKPRNNPVTGTITGTIVEPTMARVRLNRDGSGGFEDRPGGAPYRLVP